MNKKYEIGDKFDHEGQQVIVVEDDLEKIKAGCFECVFNGKFPALPDDNVNGCSFPSSNCVSSEFHYELVNKEKDE